MYIFTASDLTRKESRDRLPITSQGFPTLIPRQVTAFLIFADKLLTVEQSHRHEFQGQNIYQNSSTGLWIALRHAGFRCPTWSVMGKSSRVIKYVLTFIVVRLDFDNDSLLDITMGIDMDFGDFTRQLYQSSSPIFTEMSPRPGPFITEEISPQHVSMVGTPQIFEDFDLDMFYYINVELELMKNLPWFQLQNLMEKPGQHSCLLLKCVKVANS
jgi:hypothetical protein